MLLNFLLFMAYVCFVTSDSPQEDRLYKTFQNVKIGIVLGFSSKSGIVACELWCYETHCCSAFTFEIVDICHGNCTLYAGTVSSLRSSWANQDLLVYASGKYFVVLALKLKSRTAHGNQNNEIVHTCYTSDVQILIYTTSCQVTPSALRLTTFTL